MNVPTSPVTKNSNVKLIKKFSTKDIIDKYLDSYKVDVSEYFNNLQSIQLFSCEDTLYQFFYPFSLAGQGSFYEEIQDFPWYYESDKWEFRIAENFINTTDRVLEVGSGRGHFLKKLLAKKIECQGLEFNNDAIKVCQANGIDVTAETIETYSLDNSEKFDVVVSFQVLEHVVDVHGFIQGCLQALKPKGLLIIAVPNNDSFIKYQMPATNLPPHHMGWWCTESLRNLTNFFPMILMGFEYEPLKNIGGYIFTMERQFLPKNRFLFSIYYRLFHPIFERYVNDNIAAIPNYSMMAIYQKN
jgi:2-polyprenyl-3-methyl-5-hydroxy-6-metoxy-1,4-benzoquinol methylase